MIFQCHVSFQGCKPSLVNPQGRSMKLFPLVSRTQVLWKTRSGSDPKCAKAGKDFHMQARYARIWGDVEIFFWE